MLQRSDVEPTRVQPDIPKAWQCQGQGWDQSRKVDAVLTLPELTEAGPADAPSMVNLAL